MQVGSLLWICIDTLKVGYSLVLDGSTAVKMGTWTTGCWRSIEDCSDGMTLAIWVKIVTLPAANNKDYGIMSSLQNGVANGFFYTIFKYSGSLYSAFGIIDPADGKYRIDYDYPISVGSWYHYVYTLNYVFGSSPTFSMYRDGSKRPDNIHVHNMVSANNAIRDDLVFGNMYSDSPNSYKVNAVIDEVLLFNYTVTQSETSLLYAIYSP